MSVADGAAATAVDEGSHAGGAAGAFHEGRHCVSPTLKLYLFNHPLEAVKFGVAKYTHTQQKLPK